MPKRIVIQQPSYIPWLGYFEQMFVADVFLFFDDVQYTKRSWRSRNRVRCGESDLYLTVPIANAKWPLPLIKDTIILENSWRKKHLKTLKFYYRKAPYFDQVYPFLADLLRYPSSNLSVFNIHTTIEIARFIGIETEIGKTSEISTPKTDKSQQRIVDICSSLGSSILYNGQKAKEILDNGFFKSQGITLEYQVYKHPEYEQQGKGFMSNLSVVDPLFCVGPERCLLLIEEGHREPEIL
jgi:hypothetical protein